MAARAEETGTDGRVRVGGCARDDLDLGPTVGGHGAATVLGVLGENLYRHRARCGDRDLTGGDRGCQGIVQRRGTHAVDRLVEVDVAAQHRAEREVERMPGILEECRIVIGEGVDRKSTRLNSSHVAISYAVFC